MPLSFSRTLTTDAASMNLEERCQAIELILSDVDGVLTDGGIVFDNQGIETKRVPHSRRAWASGCGSGPAIASA